MKSTRRYLDAFMPWAGLVIGLVSVSFVHQFGSEGAFNDCQVNAPVPLLLVALLGIATCGVSGLLSWRSVRRSTSESRRVIGVISAGLASLFVFAILLAMIAALVLPPCFQ